MMDMSTVSGMFNMQGEDSVLGDPGCRVTLDLAAMKVRKMIKNVIKGFNEKYYKVEISSVQAECSRRGLAQSAKWLAEISFAIRSTQQGQDSLPQPEMGPGN